ncbi:YigZ family protein [Mesosutterella sp. OilRF-GAM-744-9]|uniref:YigZ family protein n=1 Tax=Mesosutterella porci TaxID=2915351 RepID=A0ABS9MSE5_9BURK|nr:YigZ family protein [Mesosutterella sp. oilRF-744-WT-GAM-9]MCG5031457.1 YigZ family protein [Mesosutterella sp. oilRF-744-WT-GAM-9]
MSGPEAAAALYPVPDLAPGEVHRAEITVKRSRFICSIGHTAGPGEAKAFIGSVQREFSDARHNCWAYCAGSPGSTTQVGASDDGEPHGTAGRPMLTVLLHCGTGEISAVVTRYFGGILLGTGGLVRAYQGALKEALATLPTAERLIAAKLSVTIEHRFVTQFLRLLPGYRATVVSQNFGMDAEYVLRLPQSAVGPLTHELTELTAGGALFESESEGGPGGSS